MASSATNFLRVYKDLAHNMVSPDDLVSTYWDVKANLMFQEDSNPHLLKHFKKAKPDKISQAIALDAVAHAIHQGGERVLQGIFPRASYAIFKSTLDKLAGLESSSDIRKVNRGYYSPLNIPANEPMLMLEKQFAMAPAPESLYEQVGRTTKDKIAFAIEEYERLYVAEIASPAEILTLYRYFGPGCKYEKVVQQRNLEDDEHEPLVVGGPASVTVVDREGHLISSNALKKAFENYMSNFRGRNCQVYHCLAPDTLVMKAGSKYTAIQEIKKGDAVVSHAGKSRRVLEVIVHYNNGPILVLSLGNGQEIKVTDEHPILTRDRGWVKAGDLQLEDVLMTASPPGARNGNKIISDKKRDKTLEEFYGEEKAAEMKAAMSASQKETAHKKKEAGYVYPFSEMGHPNKGKSLEEICGVERALELKAIMSETCKRTNPGRVGGQVTAAQRKGKTWEEAYGRPKLQHKDCYGENNSNWKGGISFEPYAPIFNRRLKLRIRTLDDFTCQLCDKTEDMEYCDFGRPLSIHHIDYDKQNCDEDNLITTCCSCNSKANSNRDFYTALFKEKIVARQKVDIHNGTKIVSIAGYWYNGPVYNLEVEEDHTYAGKGIIYHNSDVQTGWALPAYITKNGAVYKSGVNDKGLWLISEVRGDTRVAKRMADEIEKGKIRGYSIAGSALKTEVVIKGSQQYTEVQDLELSEISFCLEPTNQGAIFDVLKSHQRDNALANGAHENLSSPGNSIGTVKKAQNNLPYNVEWTTTSAGLQKEGNLKDFNSDIAAKIDGPLQFAKQDALKKYQQVHYRPSTSEKQECHICAFFANNNYCTRISLPADPEYTCDLFKPMPGAKEAEAAAEVMHMPFEEMGKSSSKLNQFLKYAANLSKANPFSGIDRVDHAKEEEDRRDKLTQLQEQLGLPKNEADGSPEVIEDDNDYSHPWTVNSGGQEK